LTVIKFFNAEARMVRNMQIPAEQSNVSALDDYLTTRAHFMLT